MANQERTRTLIQNAFELIQRGKDTEAMDLYRQISEIAPDDDETLLYYGNLSLSIGEIITAIRVFDILATSSPKSAVYLGKLGKAYFLNKQFPEAANVLHDALELDANAPELLRDLGAAYASIHNYFEAAEVLQRALRLNPRDVDIHSNLALCFLELGNYDDALMHANAAAKLDSKNFRPQFSIGRIYMEMGQHEAAIPYIERTIKLAKTFGGAYHALAECQKSGEENKPFIAKAEKVLSESMSAEDRAYIHFSLGKMYGDLKQWDKSFGHYRQGNLLWKDARMPEVPEKQFHKIKKVFTKKLLSETQLRGLDTELPVFIVGMPRSGSTLIEQIIASHPSAYGAGEVVELENMTREIASPSDLKHFVANWQSVVKDDSILKQYAETYIGHLTKVDGSASRVVDKYPDNYFSLGVIHLLFPKATIIHSVRDPLDTCLSCFFQPFRRLEWSTDLAWIGKWYCFYREVMDYWKAVLPPGKVIDVNYEKLVADPENQIRSIIDACHLEWNPVCLDYYKLDNAVTTASQWQVRQPIYRTSMKRWQHYAPHLGELVKEIHAYLTDDEIAFLESNNIATKKHRRFLWF